MVAEVALAKGANANFRGPAYDCGTLLHLACTGGRTDCASRLLEYGADASSRDRNGRNPLEILENRKDLRHMYNHLFDLVEKERFQATLKKAKQDVKERGPDALKNWLIEIPGNGSERRVIVCDHKKEVLQVARFSVDRWIPPSDVDPSSRLTVSVVLDGIKEGLFTRNLPLFVVSGPILTDCLCCTGREYKLLRKATMDERRAINADTNQQDESQDGAISVRSKPVEIVSDKAQYKFDVCIGDDVVHHITGRYSKLAKHYSTLPTLLGCPEDSPLVFPDSHLVRSRFNFTESAKEDANVSRQRELRRYFEAVLDVTGEYGDNVDKVHEQLQIPKKERKMLRDAVMLPEGVPDCGTVLVKENQKWGAGSDCAVCADFEAVVDAIEQGTLEVLPSVALGQAAAAATKTGCHAVSGHGKSVEAQTERAKWLEKKQREAKEQRDYYTKHDAASEALRVGREKMASELWDEAQAAFNQGLQFREEFRDDDNMGNRWDLEMWRKLAYVRGHLNSNDGTWKTVAPSLWKAVQELQTPRKRPDVLWSLDKTCSDGLVDAVYDAFAAMGVTKEAATGQLPELRDKIIIAEIEENIAETSQRVDTVTNVLAGVNSELERLSQLVDGTLDMQGILQDDFAQDPDHAQLTDEHSAREQYDTADRREFWEEILGGDTEKQYVTLDELTDVMSDAKLRPPTPEELKRVQLSNRPGQYDYNAFVTLAQLQTPSEESEILHEAFQIFDRDGNGQVTATELQHVMDSLGSRLNASELDEMMREGDRDGTGQISEDEFQAMMRQGSTAEVSNPLATTLQLAMHEQYTRDSEDQFAKHRPLPALIAVTQAVGTASRFCSFASRAATPFGEVCDLRTQQSMRRSGAPGLQLRSDCVGTQLWAYAIADLVLSQRPRDRPQPPVSFCLPGSIPHGDGQCDLDSTIADLRDKFGRKVGELRAELQRRNFVRVNTECGELALGHHRATEALSHFERAFTQAKDVTLPRALSGQSMGVSLMGSRTQPQPDPEPEPEAEDDIDEKAQLQECIDRSTKEKQRQEYVKDLHDKATAALAQKGQKGEKGGRYTEGSAQFAIARYLEAIKSENGTEHGSDSSELKSLSLMHNLAKLWHAGDDAMIAWDGRTAESKYKLAQQQSQDVKLDLQFLPTQGYAGHKIHLSEAATAELTACIRRAQAEIRRKDDFDTKIRTAEDHLTERRAESSKETFEEADEVSTNRAEKVQADNGIKRAEEERKRQSDAKEPVSQAMGLIARCRPTVWTQGVPGARPQPAEWQQAAEEAQTAIGKCDEGLRHMESEEGSLKSQVGTQEYVALGLLREACVMWKQGDEHMAAWTGDKALAAFEAAHANAEKSRAAGETPGYLGDPCHMTLDASSSLQECIASAKNEIDRTDNLDTNDESARADFARGAAGAAKEVYQKLLDAAEAASEKEKFTKLLEKATKEEDRQLGVYELHQLGVRALTSNVPEKAIGYYDEALTREVPQDNSSALAWTSTGRDISRRTEPDSLQHMRDICEAWIEGNEALLKWDGPAAHAAFERCRYHATEADAIRRTPGYAGAKICLGQGAPELEACEGCARDEVHRNDEFRRLTDLGEEELLVWKAEEARDHFTEADRLVDFELQFDKGQEEATVEKIVRGEKEEERTLTNNCIQRAEAEIARQEHVKDACGKCVCELEANSATPAIERRDKTTAAGDFCKQALLNALSTEGALKAQVETPETRALKLLIGVAAQWKTGDDALQVWQGEDALVAYMDALAKAETAAREMQAPTPGYVQSTSCKVELSQGAMRQLQACIAEAKKEIQRKNEWQGLVDEGTDHLSAWRAEKAVGSCERAKQLSDNCDQRPDQAELDEVAKLKSHASAELQRQKQVKSNFKAARKGLEVKRADRWRPRDNKTPIYFCEEALRHAASEEGELRSQAHLLQKREYTALELMLELCQEWKAGDEAMEDSRGVDAKARYDRCLQLANEGKYTVFTPGYYDDRAMKIQLTLPTDKVLEQACIAEAKKEIQRKNEWQGLVDEGTDHLSAWRAEKAVGSCERAKQLSDNCDQRPDQAELDEVAKLKSHASAELQRQKQVKSNFKAARKGLEVKRADRWRPRDNKTPIYFCEEALRHAASEEGELRSQAHLLQKREYTALELMLELCQEWKAGDEAMEDSRGVDAKARYDRCLQLANEGKYTVFTPGYYDDRAMKIQLTLPTDKVLEQCIADAAREIERREGIEATVKSGKERLEIVDRAAAHLQLPGRSGCRECRWSQHASQESPTLIISNVCHGCSPACPDAKGKDRWDIIKPHELEPVSAAVHSIEGAEEYLMAYEETRCEREKLEMVALLNEAADLLSNKRRTGLLDQERAAYADKARRTQNYLCTARGTSSKDLSARDGLGAGVAGWPGGSGLLDTLKQVAEWNQSEDSEESEGEMPWRRRGDPVITAERINDELVEALAELDKMDATNQKIREMPAMKMKHKASGGASAPAAEFSMAEGDEEEEDFEEAEEELDELDELVIDRNRERKQAVELGDRYSATATRLSSQQKSVKRMAAHLSLYVTQLERRHAELLRWRETCHSWQLAGASEDQCVKEGVLKMERIEHHGIFRRAKVVLVDVSVRIEGEALIALLAVHFRHRGCVYRVG